MPVQGEINDGKNKYRSAHSGIMSVLAIRVQISASAPFITASPHLCGPLAGAPGKGLCQIVARVCFCLLFRGPWCRNWWVSFSSSQRIFYRGCIGWRSFFFIYTFKVWSERKSGWGIRGKGESEFENQKIKDRWRWHLGLGMDECSGGAGRVRVPCDRSPCRRGTSQRPFLV